MEDRSDDELETSNVEESEIEGVSSSLELGSLKSIKESQIVPKEYLQSDSGESLASSCTASIVEGNFGERTISINLPKALLVDEEEEIPLQNVVFKRAGDIEEFIEMELPEVITVKAAKELLSKRINELPDNFKLVKNNRKLHLRDLLHSEDETIIVESDLDESTDGEEFDEAEYDKIQSSRGLPRSKVIKVKFDDVDGTKKCMEVVILFKAFQRQYLGGYKNKATGIIYHHVWCQTDPRKPGRYVKPGDPPCVLNTRETQTLLPLIDMNVNTLVDKSVQMSSSGVYIPNDTDIIRTPQPYKSYDASRKTMTPYEALVIIQRAWRRYVQFKKVREHYAKMAEERDAKNQYKGTSLQEFQKQQLELLTKDSYPIGRPDFYDLFSTLGEWKKNQLQKLKETKIGFAYKAALADILKQETKGLLAIEAQRTRARIENLQRQDIMFLEGTSTSRVRQYPNGRVTLIDDLNIQKAREFKEIFASYKRTDVSKRERIEILTAIKSYLSEFEAVDLTWDLIEILDREVDFITMGIQDSKMAILRKRFEALFMNLAKNPEFNPQAKYYKSSVATKKKYAVYRCEGCRKIMQPSKLFMHLRLKKFKLCASCSYMQTTSTASTNLAPYKRLLESLRAAEQRRCCRGSIAFLLQPWGMYFLVNVIWNGKSAISESSYLPGLKVTRWLPDDEWSMWNMILLTELEAHEHDKLADPLKHYSKEFVLKVSNKNILGRMHFSALPNIGEKFKNRMPLGYLPKDHLLYTSRKDGKFFPKSFKRPHPFFVSGQRRTESKQEIGLQTCSSKCPK